MTIYYSPEHYGLKVVAVIEGADPSDYGFEMVVVWKAKNGWAYWAADSGCSCPAPFENYHSVGELERLNRQTWDNLERAVNALPYASLEERQRFLRQVEKEVRRF